MFRHLLIFVLVCCSAQASLADLNQSMIRTTEWLVDHSEIICVVKFDVRARTVLRTIKGRSNQIEFPLSGPESNGYHYFGPPDKGHVRLLFIAKNGDLLQAVELGRSQWAVPSLHDVYFGVSQYGEVYLTESQLLSAIHRQLLAPPSPPVARRKSSTHFSRSGIEAPARFPFESGSETYVLIVDFTVARRDHFIGKLKTGDTTERLHAIKELSQIADGPSLEALRQASKTTEADSSAVFIWSGRDTYAHSVNAIRSRAELALQTLRASVSGNNR